MKKIYLTLALAMLFFFGQAQNNTYLNYRIILPSYSNSFANKGDLTIAYQRQNYTANMVGYTGEKNWAEAFTIYSLSNYLIDSENRFLISYTLSDHVTVGVSYINLFRIGEFFKLEGRDIFYESKLNSYELSGHYHNLITPSIAYELGTSFLIGSGYFIFEEYLGDLEHSKLNYNNFNHNFLGALSYRFKKLRIGVLLNFGYLYHFNTNPSEINSYYYDNMVYNFDDHRTDFYADPAFMIGIQSGPISIKGHISYPLAYGESKISRPITMIGLGASAKISTRKKLTKAKIISD